MSLNKMPSENSIQVFEWKNEIVWLLSWRYIVHLAFFNSHVLFLFGHLSYIAWIVYHLIADKYQPPNFPAQKNDL